MNPHLSQNCKGFREIEITQLVFPLLTLCRVGKREFRIESKGGGRKKAPLGVLFPKALRFEKGTRCTPSAALPNPWAPRRKNGQQTSAEGEHRHDSNCPKPVRTGKSNKSRNAVDGAKNVTSCLHAPTKTEMLSHSLAQR